MLGDNRVRCGCLRRGDRNDAREYRIVHTCEDGKVFHKRIPLWVSVYGLSNALLHRKVASWSIYRGLLSRQRKVYNLISHALDRGVKMLTESWEGLEREHGILANPNWLVNPI